MNTHNATSPIRTAATPEHERAISKNARKRQQHRDRVASYVNTALLGTLSASGDEQSALRHEAIVRQRIEQQVCGNGDYHPYGGRIQINVTAQVAKLAHARRYRHEQPVEMLKRVQDGRALLALTEQAIGTHRERTGV